MDTTKAITHVSLCAGYGGIDLGLKRAIPSLRTIAFSEIEAFACANLVSKMEAGLLDPAPIWTDLKTFPWSDFHDCVDILSGGYPCQPFSAAGKRLGADDPRHLWPYISAGIAAMRPSLCFFENVEGHISLGLPDVLQDLAGLGYRTTWCVASASECGAPHQRKRIFILAHCQSKGLEGYRRLIANGVWDDVGSSSANAVLADTENQRRCIGPTERWNGACWPKWPALRHQPIGQGAPWPSRPGEQQFAWEPPRVVVDAKNWRQPCDQASSAEIGRRPAESGLANGEGRTMENPNELRLEEHGLLNTSLPVGSSGGSDEQTDRLSNATHLRLEEQSECGQQHQEDGSGPSNPSGVCSCEAQEGRPLEHSSHWSNGEQPTEQQGWHSIGGSSEAGAMGNATSSRCPRPEDTAADCGDAGQGPWREESERAGAMADAQGSVWRRSSNEDNGWRRITEARGSNGSKGGWQAQPPLGRDADGLTHRMDNAVLHVSTDNRTDELRLLGNGVVPATAERAFRVLVGELMEEQP